jgi:hypothetical protein
MSFGPGQRAAIQIAAPSAIVAERLRSGRKPSAAVSAAAVQSAAIVDACSNRSVYG